MLTKLIAGLVALVAVSGTGLYFATAKTASGGEDCCFPGSPCCVAGASCCDDSTPASTGCCEAKAAKSDCCAAGAPCCDPSQACCADSAKREVKVSKKGSCCEVGAVCCEQGAGCCNK